MPTGSCFCQKLKYKVSEEPVLTAICHCLACRKVSSGTNTWVVMVPESGYTVTSGTPKFYTGKQESGMNLTMAFCGDCGTTVSKCADSAAFAGHLFVLAGTLDDENGLEMAKPGAELYIKHRVKWLNEVDGAAQMKEFS